MSRSTRIPTSCKFTAPKERTAPLTGFPGRGAFFRIQVVFLLYKGGEGPLPSFRFAKCHCPFLSPGGDIFPRPGEVFPSGGGLGKEGRFRPHRSTAGRSQPISGKLYAPAKASPFRERWHGIAVTERVTFGTNPLSRLRRQLSRGGEPLAKRVGLVLVVQLPKQIDL